MFTDLGLAVEVGVILAAIITAAIYVKSSVVRTRSEELEGLAETRGERIGDLETHDDELETRIVQLEGQITLLSGRLGENIASTVSDRLKTDLTLLIEAKD